MPFRTIPWKRNQHYFVKLFLLSFCKTNFFHGIPFHSIPSFGIGSSAELGMPRNECFLPRNNENRSESIPRNLFSEQNSVSNPNHGLGVHHAKLVYTAG
jgi:hypothetical protein